MPSAVLIVSRHSQKSFATLVSAQLPHLIGYLELIAQTFDLHPCGEVHECRPVALVFACRGLGKPVACFASSLVSIEPSCAINTLRLNLQAKLRPFAAGRWPSQQGAVGLWVHRLPCFNRLAVSPRFFFLPSPTNSHLPRTYLSGLLPNSFRIILVSLLSRHTDGRDLLHRLR
ncbi:uncharacterized protein M421DRAFT_313924 [Didymella exigua CBS 183.55]|uniref:Uncharacterized protein n=1 Tax=Didymella exigua CBS 183.55 TaxID=1150837 RepID=A0A6A5RVA0_9PLEO|nr:uncharacterized protein M421DRAFT_313924 [Didymella exigua CBS 183.55]KAF1931509.1 hypothetical protein M421DRAFT_313924 [Didymella exigua CBS 183.55]